jgi:hypothetical protein
MRAGVEDTRLYEDGRNGTNIEQDVWTHPPSSIVTLTSEMGVQLWPESLRRAECTCYACLIGQSYAFGDVFDEQQVLVSE